MSAAGSDALHTVDEPDEVGEGLACENPTLASCSNASASSSEEAALLVGASGAEGAGGGAGASTIGAGAGAEGFVLMLVLVASVGAGSWSGTVGAAATDIFAGLLRAGEEGDEVRYSSSRSSA